MFIKRGVAMIDRLLQMLIQEVPEELSVCEYDCPKTNCTGRNWAECKLRHQSTLRGSSVTQYNTQMVQTEAPALSAA